MAEKNGFEGVCEIFCHAAANFSSVKGYHLSCLHDVGFRLVETEKYLENSSQNSHSLVLVYRPTLIPDFQADNGTLPGLIGKDITVTFLNEFIATTEHMKSGLYAHNVEELQELVRNLETDSMSEMFVRSSFPWHGW